MLNEEVARYRELSGDTTHNVPISRIGGYLDGYEKALEQEPKTDSWSIKDVADTFKKHGLIREQEPCEDWYDVPSDEMTLEQARQAVKDLRKKLAEYLEQEPCPNAISRQAVLDAIDAKAWGFCDYLIRNGRNDEQKPVSHFADNLRECVREELPPVNPQPCPNAISRQAVDTLVDELARAISDERCGTSRGRSTATIMQAILDLPPVNPQPKTEWIPVSKRLPELNKPLLVTTYHRVYYGHLISESGNYGYPVFRIHGLGDKNRDWVQETMSHEPYSLRRIDAWMYLDIPEPYKVSEIPTGSEPQESEVQDASSN